VIERMIAGTRSFEIPGLTADRANNDIAQSSMEGFGADD